MDYTIRFNVSTVDSTSESKIPTTFNSEYHATSIEEAHTFLETMIEQITEFYESGDCGLISVLLDGINVENPNISKKVISEMSYEITGQYTVDNSIFISEYSGVIEAA